MSNVIRLALLLCQLIPVEEAKILNTMQVMNDNVKLWFKSPIQSQTRTPP